MLTGIYGTFARLFQRASEGTEVTNAQRNAEILKIIDRYTAKITASPEAARAALIKEGIYTAKGNLKAEFGGRGSRK